MSPKPNKNGGAKTAPAFSLLTGGIVTPASSGASLFAAWHSEIVSSTIFQAGPAQATRTYSTSMVDLGDEHLTLRTPLSVVVEADDEEAVASWPEIEAFGSGSTGAEALNDLKDEIIRLYRDLEATPDVELGRLPLRWKRALRLAVAPRPERAQ